MTLADELASRLAPGTGLELRFGQAILSREPDGTYAARHRDDAQTDRALLKSLSSPRDLRELARWDAGGNYRPLKTAPDLRAGWIVRTTCPKEFLKLLDAIYPGLFATLAAFEKGALTTVPLRSTLDRQTGMYRFAGAITDEMAERIAGELCRTGCLRKVLWPIDGKAPPRPFESAVGQLPLICTEACTLAVNRARALAKEAYDALAATAEGGSSS